MELEDVLDRLRAETGVVRAELMPDDLFAEIEREESGVSGAMGFMPVRNSGLGDCRERGVRLALVVTDGFWVPDARAMRMVDGSGRVVGHSIARSEAPEFMSRQDVVFLSDDFVMYPDALSDSSTVMELMSIPYRGRGGWIPEELSPVIWYPCSSSSDRMAAYFGVSPEGNATAILAFNPPGCP